MTDSLFVQDVMNTARSLADTVDSLDHQVEQVAATLLANGARRFVALGSGSSWFAAAASVYLHNALVAPSGTLALAAATGDYSLYPAPLSRSDGLVGVSVSGEVVDLLTLFERLRGQHQLVGITNAADASLTRLADHVLLMHAGRSLVPTSTKTFVTSVATLDLLWLSLLTAQGVQAAHGVREEVRTLADAVEQSLAQAQRQVAAAAERLAHCERVFVLGAGPLFPVAQEAALVFKEVAILPAEAVQTREMAQGTTAVVDERCGVVVTSPPGRGQEVVEAIVAECAGLGAAIVEVGPSSTTMRIDALC